MNLGGAPANAVELVRRYALRHAKEEHIFRRDRVALRRAVGDQRREAEALAGLDDLEYLAVALEMFSSKAVAWALRGRLRQAGASGALTVATPRRRRGRGGPFLRRHLPGCRPVPESGRLAGFFPPFF